MSGFGGRGASANLLAGNRLHLQQGPINIIAKAYGPGNAIRPAYERACTAFNGLLAGLVEELAVLRKPLLWSTPQPASDTGRRMAEAVRPYRKHWVTPMAAVAGAVADTVAAAMIDDGDDALELDKLFVNNGGDIALWLAPGESLAVGIVPSLKRALPEAALTVRHGDGVGGVATSGWNGHSFSLGIADAVTVLAESAAAADAAATLIGNAVNVEHWGIQRRPANDIDPDSDLGNQLITVKVPKLPRDAVAKALDAGAEFAAELVAAGRVTAVLLAAQQQWRSAGPFPQLTDKPPPP